MESKELDNVIKSLTPLPEVTDLFEVTGEYDIVALIHTQDILEFRSFIKNKVLNIPGVKSTVTSVILYIHKMRGERVGE